MTRMQLRKARTRFSPLRLPVIRAAAVLALLPAALHAHVHLVRAVPVPDSIATEVREIRLVFSGNPEVGFTRISLLASDSTPVALGSPRRAADDADALVSRVEAPLAPGRYTVVWQTAGKDGHPIRGRYEFVLAAGPSGIASPSASPPAARDSLPVAVSPPDGARANYLIPAAAVVALLFGALAIRRASQQRARSS